MKLIDLKCTHCGATLRDGAHGEYVCEHCGARYKVEGNAYDYHVIRVYNPTVVPLSYVQRIDNEDIQRFGEKFVAQRILHTMTHSMAEKLAEFIKIDKQQDPFMNQTLFRGTIRVVEPDFRF